jgi:hypothetical protein
MQINYYVLLLPFLFEIVGYIFYGPYLFGEKASKIIDNMLKGKHGINQYDNKMIVIYNCDKGNISKSVDNFLWKWHITDSNGKRKRIFRWTEASKNLDKVYSELNSK